MIVNLGLMRMGMGARESFDRSRIAWEMRLESGISKTRLHGNSKYQRQGFKLSFTTSNIIEHILRVPFLYLPLTDWHCSRLTVSAISFRQCGVSEKGIRLRS